MGELKWVAERCQNVLLPALHEASNEQEIKMVCENEIAFWHEKFPDKPNSLRNPHTQSRKIAAESDLPAEKKAWVDQYLSLGTERWLEVNKTAPEALAVKLENQILLRDPDKIVEQGGALLKSERWQDIAAGIACWTGRRPTELFMIQFSPCTAYSIKVEGQLKQRGNVSAEFEIPTLGPADVLMEGYTRLRKLIDVEDMTPNEISNIYHKPVSASVKRHFEHLIPAFEGGEISTQTLRSIYLRLAIFFYCPVFVDADTFAAQISGHRSYTSGEERRSYAAGPNYNGYKIADAAGNVDGRQGVKLGLDGIEPISAFANLKDGSKRPVVASKSVIVEHRGVAVLTPESLLKPEDAVLVREGMAAANMTDFTSYLTTALKRQAKNDLGLARRDSMASLESMNMDSLLKMRKHSAANERIRRAVEAIAAYNDAHSDLARWYVNATLLSYLIGGRFQTILDWLKEHQEQVNSLNSKYNLNEKYNHKPIAGGVKEGIKKVIIVA